MPLKSKLLHQKGRIQLVIDDKKTKEKSVLAELTEYEGTGCWRLEDIRLTKHHAISAYSLGSAESYCSSYSPKDKDESEYIKSKLREYAELDSGEILWASFEGPVRGHPEVNNYTPKRWANFDQVGYFDKKEGLEKLNEIKLFWDAKVEIGTDWRIDNPYRQPSESDIRSICHFREKLLDNDDKITKEFFQNMEDIIFNGLPYLSTQKANNTEDHAVSNDQAEEPELNFRCF